MGVPISKLPTSIVPLLGDYLPFSTPDPSSDTGYKTYKVSFQNIQQFIGVGPTGPQGAPGATGPTGPQGPSGPSDAVANPTAQVGLTVVNGSANTAMRSDAAPPLNQGITPTWSGLHTFNVGLWAKQNSVTGAGNAIGQGAPLTNTGLYCLSVWLNPTEAKYGNQTLYEVTWTSAPNNSETIALSASHASVIGAGLATVQALVAVDGQVQIGGTGTISQIKAHRSVVYATTACRFVDAVGYHANVQLLVAGSQIDSYKAFYAGTGFNLGPGTLTNWYGLYVDTPPPATNKFAIFVNGATESRFGGTVSIANATDLAGRNAANNTNLRIGAINSSNDAIYGPNGSIRIITGSPTDALVVAATGKTTTSTSSTSHASLNIPVGVAPTSPADGDLWYESGALKFRLGGTTDIIAPNGATGVIYFDTLAAFQATGSIPNGTLYAYVRAVTGTYPPAVGLEATPLTYKVVGSPTGLFGEITVAGVIFDPVYSTNPVNMGEFGAVGDASSTFGTAGIYITGDSTGTNVISTANTTGLVNGMHISNINWATLGAGAISIDATVVSFVPNTSITVSTTVPAGTGLKFICWQDSITGTDNTTSMQAAIDFALQHRCGVVKLPLGNYKTTDTLQVGWGNTVAQIMLVGTERPNFSGAATGPVIFPTAIDRPAIVFTLYRTAGIKGITILGRNFVYGRYAMTFNNNLSPNPADWIPPLLTMTGTNPGGLQRHSPYAGVVANAYIGTQPADHYPNLTFPAWTGLSAQYGKGVGSDLLIDECEINGFGVSICIEPNSDGNGDFTKIHNTTVEQSPYGISVCQTQSRNVEIRNVLFQGHWSFIDTVTFGVQQGQLGGIIDNCSGGEVYNHFNITMTWPLYINNMYTENSVRIGNFVAGSFGISTVVFAAGQFDLQDSLHGQIPASLITSSIYGSIIFQGTTINSNSRVSNWAKPGAKLSFIGGIWEGNRGGNVSAPLVQANNYCGGILLGGARFDTTNTNNPNIRDTHATSALRGTYYSGIGAGTTFLELDDRIKFFSNAGDLPRSPITQFGQFYEDNQGRVWSMSIPPEALIVMTNVGYAPVAPSWVNDVMTFGYASARQVGTQTIAVGDMLYHYDSGTIFVVTAVTGPVTGVYTITTQQQNNLRVDASNNYVSNDLTDFTLANYTLLIKTGAFIPRQLYYATFTSGSSNLTNIQRGDGIATDLATYYSANDPLWSLTFNSGGFETWPIAVAGTSIASLTPGNPGTGTLNANAVLSGTFPLFPYPLH